MLALLDTSEDFDVCESEIGCQVGQLMTPLNGFTLKRRPFAIDNGAFSGFKEDAFLSRLRRAEADKADCLFVVAPDVVGSARRTLEVFERWLARLSGWQIALAAQDGQQDLPIPWDQIHAIFIGGSTQWKLSEHAAQVIRAAKALGKWVHAGRVNTPGRFEYFERLGADSIDGTGLSRFSWMREAIYARHKQLELFEGDAAASVTGTEPLEHDETPRT